MQETKKIIQSKDNLIQALAIPYENVYAVNMETHEMICYRMAPVINERYGKMFKTEIYEDCIACYVENDVFEEDRYLFDKVRLLSGVKEILADKNIYSFNYRVYRENKMQYFECEVVKPDAEINEFVFGVKNVDEKIKRELAEKKKIEDALVAVEKYNMAMREESLISVALSQEYSSLLKVDAKTEKISVYRTNGINISSDNLEMIMQNNDYTSAMQAYIDTFVVPEDRARLRELADLEVLKKRVPDVGVYKIGYRRDMMGIISYYEINAVKIVDEYGVRTYILGIRDVDEEMRRSLKQTYEMETQREIIEGLASEYFSVLVVDPDTDTVSSYRATNEDGRAIKEYFLHHQDCWSRGIRNYVKEIVTGTNCDEMLEKLSLAYIRSQQEDYSLTYEKKTDEGSTFLQIRVAFVQNMDGSRVAVIGTRNVDNLIKEERQQEMALQAAFHAADTASKAKTNFLSNMSHDIRTPMNGIIGMTAIASAHIDDKERVKDCLQKITQASKHLLALINEVLDMSKIESGKVQLVEEEFNLSDLIDNLLTMTDSQVKEHHHELSINTSRLTHEAVIGDSLRIQKVFTNLLGNAVKYTPDGGKIHLTISEKLSHHAKVGCYEFVFEDNGIGMSEEFVEQIFDPFARAADERVAKIQGTGLGMPICRNIVRMMGGDIKVESTLGVGSRFTVTMYLKRQDITENRYDKYVDLDVLVVDDDGLSRESCSDMLKDLGMKAKGVSNGKEAVQEVMLSHQRGKDYFACIIDWKLPDMDGIAVTRAIRKVVGREVPIIIISAYDWTEIEQEARAAGANAFIGKPMFRSKLMKTFDQFFGEEEPIEQSPIDELTNNDYSDYRALLIEDNELNAEIASELLKMTGLSVEVVSDGTEAVDRMNECEDGYYDILFMDIQMPKMNGYDAARAIRTMDRNYCKQVPIVAMTANAFAEDVQAAKTVGMNEHIAKPLELKGLMKVMRKWVGKQNRTEDKV